MKTFTSYILLLDHPCEDLQSVHSLLTQLKYPVVITNSAEQAVAKAQELPPYLIILAGHRQNWSSSIVKHLRQIINSCGVTIVALTDSQDPSWSYQEDYSGLDGFLVKPLTGDVLTSLVQSALVKQACC